MLGILSVIIAEFLMSGVVACGLGKASETPMPQRKRKIRRKK